MVAAVDSMPPDNGWQPGLRNRTDRTSGSSPGSRRSRSSSTMTDVPPRRTAGRAAAKYSDTTEINSARTCRQMSNSVQFDIGSKRTVSPLFRGALQSSHSQGPWRFGSQQSCTDQSEITRSMARLRCSSRCAPPKSTSNPSRLVAIFCPLIFL